MSLLFLICSARKNNGLVDVAWGMGFFAVCWADMFLVHKFSAPLLLFNGMISLWALRLSAYLGYRNIGKPEDFRYAKWRAEWGKNVLWRSYLQVFMLQGFFMLIISLPILYAYENPDTLEHFSILKWISVFLWFIGFLFEAIGDDQKFCFSGNPANKGKFIRSGLWKYTRHPNYFGEFLIWWSIFVFVLEQPDQWPMILSPISISVLLLCVSGIPMLEKKYQGNPDYDDYKKTTSAFFPMPPKKL